nr:hypothetical protein [Tanacetum cinerariifolium]
FEGLSSCDMDKTTWGGRFKLFGTVPVCCRCTGKNLRDYPAEIWTRPHGEVGLSFLVQFPCVAGAQERIGAFCQLGYGQYHMGRSLCGHRYCSHVLQVRRKAGKGWVGFGGKVGYGLLFGWLGSKGLARLVLQV